ncbi:diguanylate cyclase domain-containing protein, partial [Pseudomonas viridiflava]|uniref:diguanylate cyclase domain-containing protein n=1 Tax=Pseudomonas viridiflava TaxID=33069 RepID=UPI000F0533DB
DLKVSLSICVAAYNHGLNDTSAWLHEADKALYLAKSTGRNRVVIADDIRADCQDMSVQT